MTSQKRAAFVLVFLLLATVTGAAKPAPSIVESWLSQAHTREFRKLVVIGITDDQETRHHFEDKFVSHLRGRGIEAATSHSLVADLQRIEDRNAVLDRIMEQRIDAAISVRLIPLGKNDATPSSSANGRRE